MPGEALNANPGAETLPLGIRTFVVKVGLSSGALEANVTPLTVRVELPVSQAVVLTEPEGNVTVPVKVGLASGALAASNVVSELPTSRKPRVVEVTALTAKLPDASVTRAREAVSAVPMVPVKMGEASGALRARREVRELPTSKKPSVVEVTELAARFPEASVVTTREAVSGVPIVPVKVGEASGALSASSDVSELPISKNPSVAEVVVEWVGRPLASEIITRAAVMAAASAIAEPEDTMTRLLLKALEELVPPFAMGTTPEFVKFLLASVKTGLEAVRVDSPKAPAAESVK